MQQHPTYCNRVIKRVQPVVRITMLHAFKHNISSLSLGSMPVN